MVNSGSFDSADGNRNGKSRCGTHQQVGGDAALGSQSSDAADDPNNKTPTLESADGDLPVSAIEPTPTKTEINEYAIPLEEKVLEEKPTRQARKLLCLYCDRTFVSANLRQKHVERVHSVKPNRRVSARRQNQQLCTTPCSHCDKLNTAEHTLSDLFQHLVQDHPAKYYGCISCEERFLNSFYLSEHNRNNHFMEISNLPDPLETNDNVEDTLKGSITRSKLRSKPEEPSPNEETNLPNNKKKKKSKLKDLRNKKISIKTSKIAIKRSTRLQQQAKEIDLNKKRKDRKLTNNTKPETMTNKLADKSINPYPEFDNFYRVKKITDHSIDNLKISSLTFDDVFDKAFFNRIKCNIEENLLHHIDGKLFKNEESENRISNFEKIPTAAQEIQNQNADNFGCEMSLNAITPASALSLNSQFGEDFESQIEYGSKPSKKKPQIKSDEVHYKYFTRRKYQASILQQKENRDLSKLDMWTQVLVKERQEKVLDKKKSSKELQEYTSGQEYKSKIKREELNRILDRRGPFEDLKEEATKKAAFDKLNSSSENDISQEVFTDVREVLNDLLNRVFEAVKEEDEPLEVCLKEIDKREIPAFLNLRRKTSLTQEEIDKSDKIALICSSQETENFELPTNAVRGKNETIELTGEWARSRMYICAACGGKFSNMKYLLDHKSLYHQNVWVQHYEFVGNQSELYRHLSIPNLGKVGFVEETIPCKQLWKRSEARLCTKCGKRCNSLGELHRHVLECGGDWTWMLARKKLKYKPMGGKTRRKRKVFTGFEPKNPNRIKKTETTEKKILKKPMDGPRQRPSDADTIQRMLANLPAKRMRRNIMSLSDVVFKSKKTNNTQKLPPTKVKRGSKMQTDKNIKSNSCRALRSFGKVLSSRILDINSSLMVKRKIKVLRSQRLTRNNSKNESEKVLSDTELIEEDAKIPLENTKKSIGKRILNSRLNLKNFFPVKKRAKNLEKIPQEPESEESKYLENFDQTKKNKRGGLKGFVRALSLRKRNSKDDEDKTKKPEKIEETPKKRKLTFRKVINKVKKLKTTSNKPTVNQAPFLEEPVQQAQETTVEVEEENIQEKEDLVPTVTDSENPPIPETIFNLVEKEEKGLQAKGELDFDDISNKILEPTTIDISIKPKSVPLLSPNVKGKIRKPSRGLNDCIAMLTTKLKQKDDKLSLSRESLFSTSSTTSVEPHANLLVPILPTVTTVNESPLDLSKKSESTPDLSEKVLPDASWTSVDDIIQKVIDENTINGCNKSNLDDTIDFVVNNSLDWFEIRQRKKPRRRKHSDDGLITNILFGKDKLIIAPSSNPNDDDPLIAKIKENELKMSSANAQNLLPLPNLLVNPFPFLSVFEPEVLVNETQTKELLVEEAKKPPKVRKGRKPKLIETNIDDQLDIKEVPNNEPDIVALPAEAAIELSTENEPTVLENKIITKQVSDSEDEVPLAQIAKQDSIETTSKNDMVETLTTDSLKENIETPKDPVIDTKAPTTIKKIRRKKRKKIYVRQKRHINKPSIKVDALLESNTNLPSEDPQQCEEVVNKEAPTKQRTRRKSKSSKKIDTVDNDLFKNFSLVINKKTKRIPPTSIVDDSVCDDINFFVKPVEVIEAKPSENLLNDSIEEMDMELEDLPVNSSIIIIERDVMGEKVVESEVQSLDDIMDREDLSGTNEVPESQDVSVLPIVDKEEIVVKPIPRKRGRPAKNQKKLITMINNPLKESTPKRGRPRRSRTINNEIERPKSPLVEEIIHAVSEPDLSVIQFTAVELVDVEQNNLEISEEYVVDVPIETSEIVEDVDENTQETKDEDKVTSSSEIQLVQTPIAAKRGPKKGSKNKRNNLKQCKTDETNDIPKKDEEGLIGSDSVLLDESENLKISPVKRRRGRPSKNQTNIEVLRQTDIEVAVLPLNEPIAEDFEDKCNNDILKLPLSLEYKSDVDEGTKSRRSRKVIDYNEDVLALKINEDEIFKTSKKNVDEDVNQEPIVTSEYLPPEIPVEQISSKESVVDVETNEIVASIDENNQETKATSSSESELVQTSRAPKKGTKNKRNNLKQCKTDETNSIPEKDEECLVGSNSILLEDSESLKISPVKRRKGRPSKNIEVLKQTDIEVAVLPLNDPIIAEVFENGCNQLPLNDDVDEGTKSRRSRKVIDYNEDILALQINKGKIFERSGKNVDEAVNSKIMVEQITSEYLPPEIPVESVVDVESNEIVEDVDKNNQETKDEDKAISNLEIELVQTPSPAKRGPKKGTKNKRNNLKQCKTDETNSIPEKDEECLVNSILVADSESLKFFPVKRRKGRPNKNIEVSKQTDIEVTVLPLTEPIIAEAFEDISHLPINDDVDEGTKSRRSRKIIDYNEDILALKINQDEIFKRSTKEAVNQEPMVTPEYLPPEIPIEQISSVVNVPIETNEIVEDVDENNQDKATSSSEIETLTVAKRSPKKGPKNKKNNLKPVWEEVIPCKVSEFSEIPKLVVDIHHEDQIELDNIELEPTCDIVNIVLEQPEDVCNLKDTKKAEKKKRRSRKSTNAEETSVINDPSDSLVEDLVSLEQKLEALENESYSRYQRKSRKSSNYNEDNIIVEDKPEILINDAELSSAIEEQPILNNNKSLDLLDNIESVKDVFEFEESTSSKEVFSTINNNECTVTELESVPVSKPRKGRGKARRNKKNHSEVNEPIQKTKGKRNRRNKKDGKEVNQTIVGLDLVKDQFDKDEVIEPEANQDISIEAQNIDSLTPLKDCNEVTDELNNEVAPEPESDEVQNDSLIEIDENPLTDFKTSNDKEKQLINEEIQAKLSISVTENDENLQVDVNEPETKLQTENEVVDVYEQLDLDENIEDAPKAKSRSKPKKNNMDIDITNILNVLPRMRKSRNNITEDFINEMSVPLTENVSDIKSTTVEKLIPDDNLLEEIVLETKSLPTSIQHKKRKNIRQNIDDDHQQELAKINIKNLLLSSFAPPDSTYERDFSESKIKKPKNTSFDALKNVLNTITTSDNMFSEIPPLSEIISSSEMDIAPVLDEIDKSLESEDIYDFNDEITQKKTVKKKIRNKPVKVQSTKPRKRSKSSGHNEQELLTIEKEVSDILNTNENDLELRRSRRESRKVASYNENDLIDPLIDALEKTRSRTTKKEKPPIEKPKLNSEELFDLLKKSSCDDAEVTTNINTTFIDQLDSSNGADQDLPSDVDSIASPSTKLQDPDKIYEFTEDSPENTTFPKKKKSLPSAENNYCQICKKSFIRIENLIKHKTTLTHISKLSELEAKEAEEKTRLLEKEAAEPLQNNHHSLKLVDIISDVLNKPVLENYKESKDVRRYKSLGERKSFDSEVNNTPYILPTTILEKQINLLENIIGNNRPENNYIDEISSCSNTSCTTIFNVNSDADFIKPPIQYEEISEDSVNNTRVYEDPKQRKTLNRDEELFLECCSLLKSGSEVSNSIKNPATEPESKNLIQPVEEAHEYSDNSRTPTPLGDTFDDEASNSNTISSNWHLNSEKTVDKNLSLSFEEVKNKEAAGMSFGEILTKGLKNQFENVAKVNERVKENNDFQKDPTPEQSPTPEDRKDDSDGSIVSKKVATKGARKVYEGLRVSIPTEDLNLDVLNAKKCEIIKTAPQVEEQTSPSKPRSMRKSKPVKKSQVGSNLLFKVNKKRPIQTDIYNFEETQDNVDIFIKPTAKDINKKIIPSDNESLGYADSIGADAKSVSSLSSISAMSTKKPLEPTSPQNITKKKSKIMGKIFKNAAKTKTDDIDEELRNIPEIPEIDNLELVENYVRSCQRVQSPFLPPPPPPAPLDQVPKKPKMTEEEMNMLFDQLLGKDIEKPKPTKRKNHNNNKVKHRKRSRVNSESSDEYNLNKSTKKRTNKKNNPDDSGINMEQELKECIGVASRKSQRTCTSGKQNILVEHWSSDEEAFEAMLETHKLPVEVEKVFEKPPKPKKLVKKPRKPKQVPKTLEEIAVATSNRRKRTAADPLYHWSSSEDDSESLIEIKPIREEEDEDDRPVQHGWIVGDSPKKLVTMLALTKGKKTDFDSVKEQGKRRTSNVAS